mgnify:CR=1 FL=1
MPMDSYCLPSVTAARPPGRRWIRPRRFLSGGLKAATWAALLGCACGLPETARGYTPDSPEVQQMLDKAIPYLEKTGTTNFGVGADCLVGMALVKAGKDKSHPLVQAAIASSQRLAGAVGRQGVANYCYNETIACVFLCDMDPKAYASEINALVQALVKRQRPNGAFSYEPYTYDDTSQTQYGVLSYWAAHQAGIPVPPGNVEAAAQWFMRTQDSGGGWRYSAQYPVTHSMSAAGLSSVYICAHLFGFGADAQRMGNQEAKSNLPPALQKVETEEEKKKVPLYLRATSTSAQQVLQKAAAGNAWFAKNMTYEVEAWTHYYMYGFERYKSFQELIEGKVVAEPDWYNDGVEFLQKTQAEDGSWNSAGAHASGPPVHTAFAVLFLTRSSQKSIKKATVDEGILVGGMGLPKDLTNARIQDGQVITPQMVRDVDDLLELLNSTENKEFDAKSLPGGLSLDADLTKRTSQLERLRAMVSNENFEARLAAVKTLAKSRELDNVPALIYALSDPDWRVVEAARDGLCFISRKFQGYGPPPQPTEQQVQAARDKWKEWYLAIRPDGQLLD